MISLEVIIPVMSNRSHNYRIEPSFTIASMSVVIVTLDLVKYLHILSIEKG
jgi:hypothetical protein